jgi:hypothetical protein
VTRFDPSSIFGPARDLPGEDGWFEDQGADDFVDALRSTMREEYADASDEEMSDALMNLLCSMSPAEAINFVSALDRIGTSASELASDPTVAAVAGAALPVLGGAAGTLGSGPTGTAAGTMLGGLAASALLASVAPPVAGATPVAAVPAPNTAMAAPGPPNTAAISVAAVPEPGAARVTAPVIASPSPRPASEVADGSAAAAQGLVLTQHPDVLRGLLATALGQHGRQQVSGIPVAQLLELLSQVFAQAAADADQLMYLKQAGDAESVLDDVTAASPRSLYADLLGADNLELAEAAEWDGLDL